MIKNANGGRYRNIAIVLVFVGWLASGYLFIRSTQLANGPTAATDFCKMLFSSSCDKALSDIAAWQFNFPLASLGLVYFGVLGILLTIRSTITNLLALIISALGAGVSLILCNLIYYEKITCPMCLVVHIANITTCICIFLFAKAKTTEPEQKPTAQVKWYLIKLGLILPALIAGGFTETYILRNYIGVNKEVLKYQSFANFHNEPVKDFSKISPAPFAGTANAPLKLVVFSSYQCPSCQTFDKSLENYLSLFRGKIQIEFRNYPLSSACNPMLTKDMQPRSCDAALAAIAANEQGRFLNYHRELFNSNLQQKDSALVSMARNIGLNMEKWEADRHSEAAKARLAADVKMGNYAGIYATPTVFLNGREVKRFDDVFFTKLMLQELKHPD